jgi:hypothetical protein
MRALIRLMMVLLPALGLALPARAGDPARVEAFFAVTGFDVAIDGLQVNAMAGPGLVGDVPATFGQQYADLAREVFDPAMMRKRGVDLVAQVMSDDLLNAGAAFYASDLGQRLVAVENESQLANDDEKYSQGQAILEKLVKDDPARVQIFRDIDASLGSDEMTIRALTEVQVRFTMAAQLAGVIDGNMSEDELRQSIEEQMRAAQPQMQIYGLMDMAYTYRDISDADMQAYADELASDAMRQIYSVMNATQYQIMIERYQVLGSRLGELKPQADL